MRHDDTPSEWRWLAPTMPVRIIEPYHMKIKRRDRYLLWQVNGQAIGDIYLSDDELRLTQRLWLINFGKGTGAVFQNVVIRSQKIEVDATWPEVGSEESME